MHRITVGFDLTDREYGGINAKLVKDAISRSPSSPSAPAVALVSDAAKMPLM
jgi:hypothetical protein